MTLILIIILGLLAVALLLAQQFKRGPGGEGDPINTALEQAALKAQNVIRTVAAPPTEADCARLRDALRDLDRALAGVPPGLPKYDAMKTAVEQARDQIVPLIQEGCSQ